MSLRKALESRCKKFIENKSVDLGNLIVDDPDTVYIGKDVYLGNWIHIRPEVHIYEGAEIRDFVFLGERCRIGANTRVFQYADIAAGTQIGKDCFIGHGVLFGNDKEIKYPLPPGDTWACEPATVEDNVRIGFGARILPRVVLAEGCVIGAGAVVTRSTEPGKTYVGNPAKEIVRESREIVREYKVAKPTNSTTSGVLHHG